MKERPILFSAPMVRAILEGRKTQTRRAIRAPAEELDHPAVHHWQMDQEHRAVAVAHSEQVIEQYITTFPYYRIRCPYGQPGDRLWVRESFQALFADGVEDHYQTDYKTGEGYSIYYMATDERQEFVNAEDELSDAITPSIFMPRWASRITLEVTGVRVERLQDITEDDAYAEGVDWQAGASKLRNRGCESTREAYEVLWESINAKRAPWSSNPWVWVIEFKRVVS